MPMICATCDEPVRPFVKPVTFGETQVGCAMYCQACFDAMEAPQ